LIARLAQIVSRSPERGGSYRCEKILAELGYEDVETTAPGRDGATSAKEA
jgi:hypothetical protein